jgi:hypothetical protein
MCLTKLIKPHTIVAVTILFISGTPDESEENDEKMALYSMRLHPHGRHTA